MGKTHSKVVSLMVKTRYELRDVLNFICNFRITQVIDPGIIDSSCRQAFSLIKKGLYLSYLLKSGKTMVSEEDIQRDLPLFCTVQMTLIESQQIKTVTTSSSKKELVMVKKSVRSQSQRQFTPENVKNAFVSGYLSTFRTKIDELLETFREQPKQ
jgi:hypothetical protein